ncbi:MAG: sortase, partial [Chloroflexota bacterium]
DVTGNYNDTSGTVDDQITKANAVIVVTPYNAAYNGLPHTATGSATGVLGEPLSGLDLSGTTHTNVGVYTGDPWTFTDVTGNYNDTSGAVDDQITKANASIAVSGFTGIYNGLPHGATGSATGVLGEPLSGLDLGATFINVPGGTANWTFTDVTGNYNDDSGSAAIIITQAGATIVVNGYTGIYDGAPHAATGSATGALGEPLSGLNLGAVFTDVPGGIANWTFTDVTGNYTNASGSVAIVITKADATIVVNGYTGVYDGSPHGATGSATGALGEPLSGLNLGASFTNVPGGTANWTFTDITGNYNEDSASVAIVINRADAVIVVTPYNVAYDGAAHTATGSATGVLSEPLSGLDLSATTHTNVGLYNGDPWIFTDITGNYNNDNGTVNDVIASAAAAVTLSNLNHTYDGAPKSATATTNPLGLAVSITYNGSPTAPSDAGSYSVNAAITDPNYSGSATGTLNIAQATVIPNITADDKVYNGNAAAAFTCSLTGVFGLDDVTCSGGAASFADKNVGAGKKVDATGLGLSGVDVANYLLDPTTASDTADITARTLTVTATGVDKVYDGTTAATVNLSDDRLPGDNLTVTYATADFVDPNVGINITINVSGIGISGGTDAGNYALGNTTAVTSANIGNDFQVITVITNAPATAANGAAFDVAATASSGLPVTITTSGVCSGGDTDGTATITMTSGAGTCSVFYDQAGDGNYLPAPQVQEDVTATEGPSFTSADNTSFDMGFFGTFTVTAVGNPSTMTITLTGGTLPAGVTLTDNGDGTAILQGTPAAGTSGTYNPVFTADNDVLPNGTQNFTLTIRNGPTIGADGINSIPETSGGSINENESILDTLGITRLLVKFSQDVYNPDGDTDPKDVTNPANYMLVRTPDGIFSTVSCAGGVVAPDVSISVDSVAYSNGGGSGPYIATLAINGGFPLNVVGFHRLYVCGTTSIVDANHTNLVLAGNGTTPATDFQRNFRIVVQGGGGGGGGGGSGSGNQIGGNFLIPVTGFAPNQTAPLPAQPADKVYTLMGEMTLEIPSLAIKYPIVGASIANKTWDLTWLQNSVAYLEGSAYPTMAGNTVLTAHVLDANNNLGPFSDIKGMQLGQKIYIHVNGQTYVYQVQANQKVLPNSISRVFKHEEDSWITLVTCEDFNAKTGLYTTRRMVRAVLISVIPAKK